MPLGAPWWEHSGSSEGITSSSSAILHRSSSPLTTRNSASRAGVSRELDRIAERSVQIHLRLTRERAQPLKRFVIVT